MTTATATYQPAHRFPWLLLAVAVVALAIILSAHATVKHGSDAEAVRRACNNGGEIERWQALENPRKFYRLCQTASGLVGLQIVECTARGPRERSAFVPDASQFAAGSFARAFEYVSAKARITFLGGLCQ